VQRVGHRAIRARDRDERAPRVVLAPRAQADALEIASTSSRVNTAVRRHVRSLR
jgi:hypothetical protein